MGWLLSSKYSYVPQNVTLFGDRDFFGGNQVKKRSLGWALIHMTGVLMTGNLETDPLTRRTPCEREDGRLTSQEERPGGDPSLTALRGYQPCWHLCFRLLTFRTLRQSISAKSPSFWNFVNSSPSKWIQEQIGHQNVCCGWVWMCWILLFTPHVNRLCRSSPALMSRHHQSASALS